MGSRGSALDPDGGAYSTHSHPLAVGDGLTALSPRTPPLVQLCGRHAAAV